MKSYSMTYRFYYYPSPTLANFCQWRVKNDSALCVQMDFTRTFQTKCNNINHVCSHFYNFFVIWNYRRCLRANIFDTNIYRCINSYKCLCQRYWLIGVYGTSKLPKIYRNEFKHDLYCCIRWFEMSA